jgi:hypothetical protein
MSQWDAPLLVAFAATPGAALLAFSAAVFIQRRQIGAISAVSLSLGVALLVEVLVSLAVHTGYALYELRGSLLALLGVPLAAYAVILIWLTIRWRINKLIVLVSGAFGLLGLYYLGGIVLMSSVCGISLGGC